MSEPMDARYEITVSGTDPTIAWVHACFDLEKNGGGVILSKPPLEQRGIEPVSAVVLIVVYFTVKAINITMNAIDAAATEFSKEVGGAVGREVVEQYVSKLRENGAGVQVTITEVKPATDVPDIDPAMQQIAQHLRREQDDAAAKKMLVKLVEGRSQDEIRDIAARAHSRLRATEDPENWTLIELAKNVGLIVSEE